jgi:coenzyme F420-reducing hydrogenase delta subunit
MTETDDKPSHVRLVTPEGEHTAPPKNLIRLPVITTLNTNPDSVLESALGELDCVIVIGYTKGDDGVEYFASSIADGSLCVWLLQRYIHKLMLETDRVDEEGDDGGESPVA